MNVSIGKPWLKPLLVTGCIVGLLIAAYGVWGRTSFRALAKLPGDSPQFARAFPHPNHVSMALHRYFLGDPTPQEWGSEYSDKVLHAWTAVIGIGFIIAIGSFIVIRIFIHLPNRALLMSR